MVDGGAGNVVATSDGARRSISGCGSAAWALFSFPPGAVKSSLITAGAVYLGLIDHSLTAGLRGLELATLALQRFVMGFLWIPPHEANAIDPVSSLLNNNPALTGVCSCS